jgi:hypothetical protein
MRPHWDNCITHFDTQIDGFLNEYFSHSNRRCLLVAGAGFDPRAKSIAAKLASILGKRLSALLIREERGNPAANLQADADLNERELGQLIPDATVEQVQIFADDGAPVGGARIGQVLQNYSWPDVTDVILDMSALSIGVGFPAARFLLEHCEKADTLNLHLMIASNPELDAKIFGEPADRPLNIRGFAGHRNLGTDDRIARFWLPQLGPRRGAALAKIRAANDSIYKTCPILPFPARDPRRADELIGEFSIQLRDEWQVSPQDIIYVSERNPIDSYRTISTLKRRYDRTVGGIYTPQLILSPLGSKVMAAGAMMAAIEHEINVQYVETLRYDFQPSDEEPRQEDMIVHIWLHGPIYAGYKIGSGR